MYRKIQDLSGGPWFRLLTLQPLVHRFDERIVVEVQACQLHDGRPYEALSYCWGDLSERVPITLNGSIHFVTKNLHKALQHLRSQSRMKTMWIDALCINQDDLKEREHQVKLMGDIYMRAQRVLVWLGSEDDDTHLAFWFFQQIDHEDDLDGVYPKTNKPGTSLRYRHDIPDSAHQPEVQDDRDFHGVPSEVVASVYRVLDKPWWHRVWVIQEFAFAREIFFLCGRFLSSEYALKRCYDITIEETSRTTGRRDLLDEGVLAAGVFADRASLFQVRAAVQAGAKLSLLELLIQFRTFKATDARDKVYSLLNLMEPEPYQGGILVDYGISVEECYRQVAATLLLHNTPYDLLNVYNGATIAADASFPSWVPDWREQTKFLYLPIIRPSTLVRELHRAVDSRLDFKCSHRANRRPSLKDDRTLSVSGLVLDEITELTEPCTALADLFLGLPFEGHKVRTTATSNGSAYAPAWFVSWYWFLRGCYYIGGWCETLLHWEALAQRTVSLTGPNDLLAFCTTLCGARIPDDEVLGHYQQLMHVLRRTRLVYYLRAFGVHKLRVFYWVFTGFALASVTFLDRYFEYQVYKNPLVTSNCLIHHRRLGRTSKGFLVLVPEKGAIGDSVVLVDAGRTPCILRPSKHGWLLVGEAYVHGVMFGEAWDERKVESIDLI